jgi:hypothetical protein
MWLEGALLLVRCVACLAQPPSGFLRATTMTFGFKMEVDGERLEALLGVGRFARAGSFGCAVVTASEPGALGSYDWAINCYHRQVPQHRLEFDTYPKNV